MTTAEILVALIVAVFGSNGLWMLISKAFDKKSGLRNDVDSLKEIIQKLEEKIECLSSTLEKHSGVCVSIGRDRLNYLNHKYRDQGFIPKEDYVTYKLIGEAYKKADGNTIVKEEFDVNIKELPKK